MDWALHDKGDGNPHAHIMLTMRGIDEHEEWLQKQKAVFANARDDNGRAIYDPSQPVYDSKKREETSQYRIPQLDENGKQKTRARKGKGTEHLWEKITIPANDWNDHSKAEVCRASWAEHSNRYLEKEHQIAHRSYKRQGLDTEPTIHEGVTSRKMEQDGKMADRCQINRDIRERNSLREQMNELAREITAIITEKAGDILGRFKEFRRSLGDPGYTGRDARHTGKTTGRNRYSDGRESELAGAAGRINELKRAAERTGKNIERTDSEIADTDKRILYL